jgi:hypothetical protein
MPQENCRNAVRPHTKPLSLGEGLYIVRSSFSKQMPRTIVVQLKSRQDGNLAIMSICQAAVRYRIDRVAD